MVLDSELQVVVPVGFLLAEARDVSVCVERPGEAPLPIRLRLVPARVREHAAPVPVSNPTPAAIPWPARTNRVELDSDYTELGGNG